LKELGLRKLTCLGQKVVAIEYKGFTRDEPLRLDVLVEDCVLVEVKAVETVLPIHKAQLLSYMKLLNVPIRSADQLPRSEGHRRRKPFDPARREPMRQKIQQEKTERTERVRVALCSLSCLLLKFRTAAR